MNVSDRFFFSSFHFPSVLLSCSQPLVPNVLSFPLISFPFMFLSLSFFYISFAFRFLSLISFEFQLLSLPFHLIAIVGFLLFLFSCSFCFLSESEENIHTHIYIDTADILSVRFTENESGSLRERASWPKEV